MINRTSRKLKSLLLLFVCALCIVALIPPPLTRATGFFVASGGTSKLLKHDRTRLIEAVAQNKQNVTLVIAARRGMNDALASHVRDLQGTVQYRDDEIDYQRVELPTRNVLKLSYSPAIESINLTGKIDYYSAEGDEDNQAPPVATATEVPPPSRDTPRINPYLPSAAIGAPQFIASHPTFDGRGVVVGFVDTNIDLLLPELQTAKTLEGNTVPKFADIVAAARDATVPIDDAGSISGYMQVTMQSEVTTSDSKLTYQNRNYVAPADGKYRIGTLNERKPSTSGDLNRDGNPDGSNPLFDLLWNESTNTVWVDTNQNFNFADEKPMTDYHVRHDIGRFGKDDPTTAVRETVGFTIQTDTRLQSVFVIAGYGTHGTGTSGSAFGAGFFGGKIDGVAPGAQIISVPSGRGPRQTAAVIESLITAMKDPRVDLVTLQFGNYLPQNDGRATFSIIAERLITKYQKLIFAGAGNSTERLNVIMSPADGREVVAVGTYISNETSKVNNGFELRDADNMNGFTSRGPTKDGRLKPDLLAPTDSLSTRPGFLTPEKHSEPYSLPPGYQTYSGTSTATPFAAAGAALLISAAKQSGVKYDARRLRRAILGSARYLPKYRPEMQGAGLFQIQAAWEALKDAPEPIDIISRAPVKAALSENLLEPNHGAGIYEREGWTAGQSGKRTVNVTRTSGQAGPMKFQLRWTGNDGTFASPAAISLPLNTPVDIPISISPQTSGIHSAVLNLVSVNGALVHQIMNMVIAAEQLTAGNNFTITRTGHAEWLHSQSYFVYVPPGTPALRVDLRIAEGNVRPFLSRPDGRYHYFLARGSMGVEFTGYQKAGSWSRVVTNPDPGVWQIAVDNCSNEKPPGTGKASFSVTASLLGIVMQGAVSKPSTDFTRPAEIRYSNSHGSFVGEIADTGLASVFAADINISGDEPREFEIDVAPGATRVGACIDAAEGASGDVDLYLFDCTAGECTLRDFSTRTGSSEQVAIDSPAAGKWKVIVNPFKAPGSRNSVHYKDYLLHPAFGHIQVTNDRKPIPHQTVVTQPIVLKIGSVPVGPRSLEAMLLVISRPGPNIDTQKRPDTDDVYFPDHAVLGTVTIPLKMGVLHSTRR
jgi:hypothetical protein